MHAVNLQNANLSLANLQNVNLLDADLSGANLRGVAMGTSSFTPAERKAGRRCWSFTRAT